MQHWVEMVKSFCEIFYEECLSSVLESKPALVLLAPMVSSKVFHTSFKEKP